MTVAGKRMLTIKFQSVVHPNMVVSFCLYQRHFPNMVVSFCLYQRHFHFSGYTSCCYQKIILKQSLNIRKVTPNYCILNEKVYIFDEVDYIEDTFG